MGMALLLPLQFIQKETVVWLAGRDPGIVNAVLAGGHGIGDSAAGGDVVGHVDARGIVDIEDAREGAVRRLLAA